MQKQKQTHTRKHTNKQTKHKDTKQTHIQTT